jgi:hypothetical protein
MPSPARGKERETCTTIYVPVLKVEVCAAGLSCGSGPLRMERAVVKRPVRAEALILTLSQGE